MSWDQHLQNFYALDEDDPAKAQMGSQFLDAIGREFLQGHQIVGNASDGELEMRATWHGTPVRAKLDTNFALLEWEMRAPNPTRTTLHLLFDVDAIPKVGSFSGAVASAWDDGDEEEMVFFGRGYHLKASRATMPRALAVYGALPPPLPATLATHMVGDEISKLYVYDAGSLYLTWTDGLHELRDAYHRAARGVWLLGQVAHGLSQIDPSRVPAAPATHGAGSVMTCGYCQTRFILQQRPACPNCGAHPR